MAHWLLKTEPSTYSFADLLREERTAWTGVKNPQAQLNLKAMKAGDAVALYHTGSVKAVVGLGTVACAAYPDPTGDRKRVCVDVRAAKPLGAPVTLDAIKTSKAFARSPLLAQGRLSVVPLTAAQWRALQGMGRKRAEPG
jgi:predicted RNA-binding protein with PUA-like domain